jgi:predicted secreted hydrolase
MTAVLEGLPKDLQPQDDVYPKLLAAAQDLQSAEDALVILSLLGANQYYGMEVPPGPPNFPADHLMHLGYSNEWYWFSANLTASNGDQLGLLYTIHRSRLCTTAIQAQAGWTDEQAQGLNAEATVVIKTPNGATLDRRDPSVHWAWDPGQTVQFPTETDWVLQCGGFTMTGGTDQVLPLQIQLTEPGRSIDLTVTSDFGFAEPWFLQGANGYTPEPQPGIYYSWPQLTVAGTIQIGGTTWQVTGTGWIDHQLMMSRPVPGPILPVTDLSERFNGWNWCQFNLQNGDAYTGVAFQVGTLAMQPSSLALYVQKTAEGWNTIGVSGDWTLTGLTPTLFHVLQPTAWTYQVQPPPPTQPPPPPAWSLTLAATPLHEDGSFMTGNGSWFSEVPCTLTVNGTPPPGSTLATGGTGYSETNGFEVPSLARERLLALLAGAAPTR